MRKKNKEVFVKGIGMVELEDEKSITSPQETIGSKNQDKKLQAEWIVAESILGEIITNDFSKESYEKYSVTDMFWSKENNCTRISWETWKRYYIKNFDNVISRLKNSTEYRDCDGVVHPIAIDIEKKPEVKKEDTPILPKIKIGGYGQLISQISEDIANIYSGKKILFYKQETKNIVEVSKIKHDGEDKTFMGFSIMKPKRFITLSEKYFLPYIETSRIDRFGNQHIIENPTSLTNEKSSIILESPQFQDEMPMIKRIFTVQTPIIHNGELTFPKEEYDERFFSWLPRYSPIIEDMNMQLEKAKEVILNIFKEFCFETHQDYINAISALLTPFLQGLYKTGFSTRTPVYCYEANRERSGKDYLAGVTGILYEGYALEEPPISNGEYRSSGSNDELKKKLLAAMISGRRRLHFSNNKGHLNNSVFESIITAMKFSDRLLGKNEIVTLDNELNFSFSGNLGITLTPDLSNRTIFINLFLDIEDANKRKFKNPNLHGYVLENRNTILSALYSLVKNWFNKGCPEGSVPFASFPEWARVCGGIMETAGYDNPCNKSVQNAGVSIDRDTDEMKELFEICNRDAPDIWLSKDEIKAIINKPGENIMTYIDWSSRSSQIKFGIKLNKFVGRLLSDVRLLVEDNSIRSSRWKYKFTKKSKNNEKMEIFS